MLIHHYLSTQVKQANQRAQKARELPDVALPDVRIEQPRHRHYGDYATPTALEMARPARMSPLKIAEAIAAQLADLDYGIQAEVSPPGFINFHLANTWLQGFVECMLSEPHHLAFCAYGLASAFHPAYKVCRVLPLDVLEPLCLARFRFYLAAKALLRHSFSYCIFPTLMV